MTTAAARRRGEVEILRSPLRNLGIGMIAGPGTPVPARTIDVRLLELAAGERTSTHRHTHDSVLVVLEGEGCSTIGGRRVRWSTGDALHTPAWSWHFHEIEAGRSHALLLGFSNAPLLRALRLNWVQDAGMVERREEHAAMPAGRRDDPSAYGRELLAANAGPVGAGRAPVHTASGDLELRPGPGGARTALLVDSALGYETSGLALEMIELPPDHVLPRRRDVGESCIHVVSGNGHSVIDGTRHDWSAGDTLLVGHLAWHEHGNDDQRSPAVVLRAHQGGSILDIMGCLMDPAPAHGTGG
ncbi:MAG TPA: cupin domain-containing protein [Acidimicrobiales bacterium]|nr:cupin domain-containing protein [Acidimicrobiales bacterium]